MAGLVIFNDLTETFKKAEQPARQRARNRLALTICHMPQLAAINIYDAPPSGAQPWINAQYPHLPVLVYFFINKIVARNTNI
jgi:hypothetical protein